MIVSREWFVVDLAKIEEVINLIVTRLQSEQKTLLGVEDDRKRG